MDSTVTTDLTASRRFAPANSIADTVSISASQDNRVVIQILSGGRMPAIEETVEILRFAFQETPKNIPLAIDARGLGGMPEEFVAFLLGARDRVGTLVTTAAGFARLKQMNLIDSEGIGKIPLRFNWRVVTEMESDFVDSREQSERLTQKITDRYQTWLHDLRVKGIARGFLPVDPRGVLDVCAQSMKSTGEVTLRVTSPIQGDELRERFRAYLINELPGDAPCSLDLSIISNIDYQLCAEILVACKARRAADKTSLDLTVPAHLQRFFPSDWGERIGFSVLNTISE